MLLMGVHVTGKCYWLLIDGANSRMHALGREVSAAAAAMGILTYTIVIV
jgi:hypothetical protein